jgi:hypothetical protein
MTRELVHITVGYPSNSYMELLRKSSEWNGCQFVGLPRHWGSARFDMFAKETMVKSYLETGDIDLDSVVMFTDAYDVLIVEHASSILEKFYDSGADLIFAGEPNFFPDSPNGRVESKAQFDAIDSTWRYLNGGGWIGYGWAVKQMVDDIAAWVASKNYDPSWENNDQPFLQEYYLNNRASTSCRIKLDTAPDFFCCLISHIDEFVVHHSRVRARRSEKPISVLHANGNKGNLELLPRYWDLCGGRRGSPRLHDLRVATKGGQLLGYNAEHYKLVPSHALDPELLVFLVKGDRHALALTAGGLMTLNPNGNMGRGATKVDIWEVLGARDAITSFHGLPLEAFCLEQEGPGVTLAPLSLLTLMSPAFDGLLEMIERHEDRL